MGAVTGQLEQGQAAAGGSAAATTVLLTLAVHPDVQRQGVGRELLDALITAAEGLGSGSVVTDVAGNNQPALEFFKREGFRVSSLAAASAAGPKAGAAGTAGKGFAGSSGGGKGKAKQAAKQKKSTGQQAPGMVASSSPSSSVELVLDLSSFPSSSAEGFGADATRSTSSTGPSHAGAGQQGRVGSRVQASAVPAPGWGSQGLGAGVGLGSGSMRGVVQRGVARRVHVAGLLLPGRLAVHRAPVHMGVCCLR